MRKWSDLLLVSTLVVKLFRLPWVKTLLAWTRGPRIEAAECLDTEKRYKALNMLSGDVSERFSHSRFHRVECLKETDGKEGRMETGLR